MRPGSSTISVSNPPSCSWAHARKSSAASVMAPRSAQSGSNAGDRHSMRVYSASVGSTRFSQVSSIIGRLLPG